jgi:hypothetical protein
MYNPDYLNYYESRSEYPYYITPSDIQTFNYYAKPFARGLSKLELPAYLATLATPIGYAYYNYREDLAKAKEYFNRQPPPLIGPGGGPPPSGPIGPLGQVTSILPNEPGPPTQPSLNQPKILKRTKRISVKPFPPDEGPKHVKSTPTQELRKSKIAVSKYIGKHFPNVDVESSSNVSNFREELIQKTNQIYEQKKAKEAKEERIMKEYRDLQEIADLEEEERLYNELKYLQEMSKPYDEVIKEEILPKQYKSPEAESIREELLEQNDKIEQEVINLQREQEREIAFQEENQRILDLLESDIGPLKKESDIGPLKKESLFNQQVREFNELYRKFPRPNQSDIIKNAPLEKRLKEIREYAESYPILQAQIEKGREKMERLFGKPTIDPRLVSHIAIEKIAPARKTSDIPILYVPNKPHVEVSKIYEEQPISPLVNFPHVGTPKGSPPKRVKTTGEKRHVGPQSAKERFMEYQRQLQEGREPITLKQGKKKKKK